MKYIVIDKNDTSFHYIVEDLQALISEMYEYELDNGETFEQASDRFYRIHKIFQTNGDVNLLSN